MNQLYSVFFLFSSVFLFAQESTTTPNPFSLEADFFYGSILEHNPDIAHLITDHPSGFTLGYNRKTYGLNEIERRYNYPDWGFTFVYQDMKNEFLGENYSIYGHFNMYFLNRRFVLRIGQGIAYNTNPYDRDTNFYNNAYGTHLLSTTFLKVNYVRENVWKGLGYHAGFSIIHYSNANLRAPNTSTNTWAFNIGTSYLFDHENFPEYIKDGQIPDGATPYDTDLKYNFAFRFGWNESDEIGLGQFPFYVGSAFVSKRIGYKSTLTAGVDAFFAKFLEEEIYFRSIAYPEEGLSGDEDWKRVGIFVGHELHFSKVAFVTQLGYYVYWPYEFENRVYNRFGLKRYFLQERAFVSITVKAHWAKAEGAEFGIGFRL